MIGGIFHKGSGLGDQLFRYITVRSLALDKGFDWMMVSPENFKGKDFMSLIWTINSSVKSLTKGWNEKDVRENGIDIRSYDPEINFVEDNTLIDGCFEDEKYWGHHLEEIKEWLKVEPLEVPDDTCVIGFRGGEYATVPDLFLPQEYWSKAIQMMRDKGINKFEVHTDDKELARQYFPTFPIIQDIGINWRSMRFAKHAIIANSAFYIIPRLLSGEETLAPRYWARRNLKIWARPAAFYKYFQYL